jgi:hypothetical protein
LTARQPGERRQGFSPEMTPETSPICRRWSVDRARERTPPDRNALQPLVGSSRIRPANDRETSRNDGNGWSIESAGQEPDSAIVAGSEIGPENTLKVETQVRTPLGLLAGQSYGEAGPAPGPECGPDEREGHPAPASPPP